MRCPECLSSAVLRVGEGYACEVCATLWVRVRRQTREGDWVYETDIVQGPL